MATTTGRSTEHGFPHLEECERLLMKKIGELPMGIERVNTYYPTLMQYFRNLSDMRNQRLHEGTHFRRVAVKCVTEALRELWVIGSGKESTFKIFEDFESFERILFQSLDYRGHYVHQFDVFLLGYYILNRILTLQEGIGDNKLREKFRRVNNPNFTWMLAATFHDMGYPIEQIDRWFSTFLKMFLKVDVQYPIEPEKLFSPSFYEYLRYLSEEHYSSTQLTKGESFRDWRFHERL